MTTGSTDRRADPDPTRLNGGPPPPWGRPLALATALVFLISSVFPAVAGLSKDTAAFPGWWGELDVGIAFFLAILVFLVMGLAQGRVDERAVAASYRAYRVLTHGIFAMLVVFFLAGDRIIWPNCLTGFAWRAWLLCFSLPAWFTAFGARSEPVDDGGPPRP